MGKRHDRGSPREAGIRTQRLEEILREELNSILSDEVTDQTLEDARVTRVELSRDGARARVWVGFRKEALPGERRESEASLERAARFIRSRLCEVLPMKRTPELSFRVDPGTSDPSALLEQD